MTEAGSPQEEYLDASRNMRQFGNVRFAQMSLYVALSAALLAGLFQADGSLSSMARVALKIGGLVTTLIFAIMDQRAMEYWHYFRRHATKLEKDLGYQQYTKAPAKQLISATTAIRVLYVGMLTLWIVSLVWNEEF